MFLLQRFIKFHSSCGMKDNGDFGTEFFPVCWTDPQFRFQHITLDRNHLLEYTWIVLMEMLKELEQERKYSRMCLERPPHWPEKCVVCQHGQDTWSLMSHDSGLL